jgi:hypothetical protein
MRVGIGKFRSDRKRCRRVRTEGESEDADGETESDA